MTELERYAVAEFHAQIYTIGKEVTIVRPIRALVTWLDWVALRPSVTDITQTLVMFE